MTARAFSAKRTISNFCSNSWRGTSNYSKGGAIFAMSADVKIYTSTFKSNTADMVRMDDGRQKFPDFSPIPIPGGGHAISRAELSMLPIPMSRWCRLALKQTHQVSSAAV
jgi:hypothetical protein